MNSKKVFPERLAQSFLKEIVKFLKDKRIISTRHVVLVNIANVSKEKIKKFNSEYRKKKEATDILSFGYGFDKDKLEGDLILCWEIIRENAKEDGIKEEQELLKNLIHGCLHLTGHEHSEEMFQLQKEFLKIK